MKGTQEMSEAVKKALDMMNENFGNPSSLHQKGIDAYMLLCDARKEAAKALCCDEKEIFFTSGGTEGNNLAVFGAAYANKRKGNRVITSAVEHPSVQKAFDRLEKEGFDVTIAEDFGGRLFEITLF